MLVKQNLDLTKARPAPKDRLTEFQGLAASNMCDEYISKHKLEYHDENDRPQTISYECRFFVIIEPGDVCYVYDPIPLREQLIAVAILHGVEFDRITSTGLGNFVPSLTAKRLVSNIVEYNDQRHVLVGMDAATCQSIFAYLVKENLWGILTNTPAAQVSPSYQNYVLVTYINGALSLLTDVGVRCVIKELAPLIQAHKIRITDGQGYTQTSGESYPVRQDTLLLYGFFCVASFSKVGTEAKFINDWVGKRLTALFAKANFALPPSNLDMATDLGIIGKYLNDYVEVRRAFAITFLSNNPSYRAPLGIIARSQLAVVLEEVGLTTFMLSYRFATAVETEAHTIIAVIEQTDQIIKTYADMKQQHDEKYKHLGIDFKYSVMLSKRDSALEMARYPELAYCAIFKMKYQGAKSWSNYQTGELENNLDINTLRYRTSRLLDYEVHGEQGQDDMVANFLKKMNRTLSKEPRKITQFKPPTDPYGL